MTSSVISRESRAAPDSRGDARKADRVRLSADQTRETVIGTSSRSTQTLHDTACREARIGCKLQRGAAYTSRHRHLLCWSSSRTRGKPLRCLAAPCSCKVDFESSLPPVPNPEHPDPELCLSTTHTLPLARMAGSGVVRTLDDEIDEWERAQERQQRDHERSQFEEERERQLQFEEEREEERERQRRLSAKEATIMSRLFGEPRTAEGPPPTRWRAGRNLHFFAEAEHTEFLRNSHRVDQSIKDRVALAEGARGNTPGQAAGQQRAPRRGHEERGQLSPDGRQSPFGRTPRGQQSRPQDNAPSGQISVWPGAKDWLRDKTKPRTPTMRRSRSSLAMIDEARDSAEKSGNQHTDRVPSQGVERGLWSRGSNPSDVHAQHDARDPSLTAGNIMASPSTRSESVFSRGAALTLSAPGSRAASSRGGGILRSSGGDRRTHMDGSGNPTSDFFRLGTAGSKASSRAAFEGSFDHDRLFTEHKPETKEHVFTFEKIKLFDEKTGKWRNKRRDVNAEVSKDQEGHGDTVYPRIPQVFEDPAQATAEALLQAKTDEEKKMIFDKIAMDSRPGGQQTAVVDFEADVGLVLTDSVHGVMIELIEAGSAASQHKGIKPGDYVLEVDETEATDLRAEQIEEMLIGKEGTTVRLKLQSDLFSQAHAVTLMRQSLEDDLKRAPKDFLRREEESVCAFGYNEFGQLSTGHKSDSAAPVIMDRKTMGTWELRHRIKLASVGWYHNVIIARKKWTTSRPPVWDNEDVQAGRIPNLEIATALAEWATPDFRRKIRSDVDELPDDAEELVDNYRRKELLSMYHSMIQSRGYGSAKKLASTFVCGRNKDGQLGIGHNADVPVLRPVEMLVGEKVDYVACGGHHTLLLMNTGAVLAFGANGHGQLGNGTILDTNSPVSVTTLTPECTRNPNISAPSRILLVTNLEIFVQKYALVNNFKTCYGYQGCILRRSDKTTVPGDKQYAEGDRPVCLVFFQDILTAAHAKAMWEGKVVGEDFIKLEMRIFFFHPHQAGSDYRAWFSSRKYAIPYLCPTGVYVKQIAAGYDHSMALLSNGQVASWGHNQWGQCGTQPKVGVDPEYALGVPDLPDDAHLCEFLPVILPFCRSPQGNEPPRAKQEKVKMLAVGGNHNLFLLDDGRVMGCGRNDHKQLGLGAGSGTKYHTVMELREFSHKRNACGVRCLYAGASHSLATMYDGQVLSWGRNDSYQCGFSDTAGQDVETPREIKQITKVGKPVIAVAVNGGNEHTIITCQGFKTFVFGLNKNGQLGLADKDTRRFIEEPAWQQNGVNSQPLVGGFHTFVFNRNPLVSGSHDYKDSVYAWGYNKHGELGLGFSTESFRSISVGAKVPSLLPSLEMRKVEQFACGWYHSFCIYHDQRDLRCDLPPSAFADTPNDRLPDHVAGGKRPERINEATEYQDRNGPSGEVRSFLLGEKPPAQHLVGWGYNRRGQLGLGHSESQDRPVFINLERWGVRSRIRLMCCGGMSSYIVTENNEVWAFGSNSKGQLGDGKRGGRQKAPIKIAELCGKNVQSLSSGYDHCFALVRSTTAGVEVYSWGNNTYGQLGLGHSEDTHSPAYVPALSKIRLQRVICGGQHTIALTSDSVWSMGRNDYGQLGLGTISRLLDDVIPPSKISFLSHATAPKTTAHVACGPQTSFFVLANGELLGCGRNDSGQLGLGSFDPHAVPSPCWILTQQLLNGNRVISVSASDHTIISLSNGEVIGCGQNHNGQLGLGHTIMTADLQTLPLDSHRASIHVGAFHSFVMYGGSHPRRQRNSSAVAAGIASCTVS